MRRRWIGLCCLWWLACEAPITVPPLPLPAQSARTAVLFAIDDGTISALALDPGAASPPALALTSAARLELRTFSCDREVLGMDSEVVRYDRGGPVLECEREGVPCGLARYAWALEEGAWTDASREPNLGWFGARPDPEPTVRAYGPVELPVLIPGALLQEQWISSLEGDAFLVAFKVIASGRVLGGQLGRYRFHPEPGSLQLEDTTMTSTSWIGGRQLPDGRVALISDTGLSAFLDPQGWTITPGPNFDRGAAVCDPRPGDAPDRSLRGALEYWDPGDGSPLVLWAATSCGAVLRRRLDDPGWQRLDPGELRGAHVHLLPYGADRAFVAGTARSSLLSVIGDRSRLEALADDAVDVGYVGPGPNGAILAGGTRPLLGGTQIYRREGSGWDPFLEVTLGARAFQPVGDGLLVMTTLVRQPVLFRIPGRPYEEEGTLVDLKGTLVSDLRPIGPRRFGGIVYGPGEGAGVSGAVVLVTEPLVRCDLESN